MLLPRPKVIYAAALFAGTCSAVITYDTANIMAGFQIINQQTVHDPALALANQQLLCMQTAAQNALNPANTADRNMIIRVFGSTPAFPVISMMADQLATTNPVVAADHYPLGDGVYGAGINGVVIAFSPLFHDPNTGLRQRARTIIHESSHILQPPFKTEDRWGFDAHGGIHPIPAGQPTTGYVDWGNGYWHVGYNVLRATHSNWMHLNADTWAVFGYRCHFGTDPPVTANWTP